MRYSFPTGYRTAIALVLFVFGTRLPVLIHPFAIDDERTYSVVAIEMLHGGLPYRNAIDRKPPGLFWLYEQVYRVTGTYSYFGLHLVAVLWTLATMWLLYLVARRLFDRQAGVAAALLYGLFMGAWGFRGLAMNGEMLMNLPIVAALALTFGPNRGRARPEMFAAGILSAVAVLLKQTAGVAPISLGLYVLQRGYRQTRGYRWRHSALHAALLSVGFASGLLLSGVILWREGILEETIYWSILDHRDLPLGPFDLAFWQLALSRGALFLLSSAPLLVAATVSIRDARHGAQYWVGRLPEFWGLVVLLGVSMIGTSAGGRFYGHYFLQLLPPLSLLAAPVVGRAFSGSTSCRVRLLQRTTLARWLALTAVVFLAVEVIGLAGDPAQPGAARFLEMHARSNDRIFVWGQNAGFYLYARRRAASRYIATFPLTGYVFGSPRSGDRQYDTTDRIVPGSWDLLRADFEAHPPQYIVDCEASQSAPKYPIERFPFLRSYLAQHYRLVHKDADSCGMVYERNTSQDTKSDL